MFTENTQNSGYKNGGIINVIGTVGNDPINATINIPSNYENYNVGYTKVIMQLTKPAEILYGAKREDNTTNT